MNINVNYIKKLYLRQGTIIDFDLSVFRTQFSNKIIPDYSTDVNKIIYGNLNGKSISQGASLNFNMLVPGGFRINMGATYIDTNIQKDGIKTMPFLTERFQGVWKVQKKWNSEELIFDITGSTVGPLKLPTLSNLDPRPIYSTHFNIVNIQLTKTWGIGFQTYGGLKNIFNFTPPVNSIARAFDPFDKQVLFDDQGDALATANNPFALTFDPSYVFASNQGIRFFFGVRWNFN